ncbi:tomoregulin-2-like [Aplochiton taeniatus]
MALPSSLRAFPAVSLIGCQTPSGWNCTGFEDSDFTVFQCDSCQFEGVCVKMAETIACVCDFKCPVDGLPVCGSNANSYPSVCLLHQDSCLRQTEILLQSQGNCPTDAGSGSGDEDKGSAEEAQAPREHSSCEICQFGAECNTDDEDIWCVCNIDCSHISFNPVCASDGRSYDNPCQLKEASCQRQKRIEVTHLGYCQGGREGGEEEYGRAEYTPCPEHYRNYCVHGLCEYSRALPSCSCHAGFSGFQCEQRDSLVFVVPGSGTVRYVLIAAIVGALQITVVTLVVLWLRR